MGYFSKNNKGLTLVEILISIALIGIIAIAFLPLFQMSAVVLNRTEHTLEDTYTGKDTMELMYNLSSSTNYEGLKTELLNRGYIKDEIDNAVFIKKNNITEDTWIELRLTNEGDLVRVVTRVYSDMNRTKLETKYEAYYRLSNKENP